MIGRGSPVTSLSIAMLPASTVVQTYYTPTTIFATSATVINGTPTMVVVAETSLGLTTQTVVLPASTGECLSSSWTALVLTLSVGLAGGQAAGQAAPSGPSSTAMPLSGPQPTTGIVTLPAETIVQTIYVPSTVLSTSTGLVNGVPTAVVFTRTTLALQTQTLTQPPRTGESQFRPDSTGVDDGLLAVTVSDRIFIA